VKCSDAVEGEDRAHDCTQCEDHPHFDLTPFVHAQFVSNLEKIMNTVGLPGFTRIDECDRPVAADVGDQWRSSRSGLVEVVPTRALGARCRTIGAWGSGIRRHAS
jgi:hypothetical protein